MSFSVDYPALTGYARQLERDAEDATEIRRYFARYAEAGTGGEVYSIARSGHEHAVQVVDGTLNRLVCLLQASTPELELAARYYHQTDLAAAATVDSTLPSAVERCSMPLELELAADLCRPPRFVNPRYAIGHLDPPPEAKNPANPLAWMDFISPSSWANSAFDIVFGFDPIGWLQQRVLGDWEALAAMGSVVTNIGGALHDLAYNLQSGTQDLRATWQGNAGEAAYRYFTDVAYAVGALQGPLQQIGQAYLEMAEAVWSIGEALGGVVKGLLDAAIIAGITAGAGTVTAETGVGAAIGYGIAAAEVANMLRLWGNATQLYQNLSAAVNTFRALLDRQLSDLDSIAIPTILDGARYDHPLVAL